MNTSKGVMVAIPSSVERGMTQSRAVQGTTLSREALATTPSMGAKDLIP